MNIHEVTDVVILAEKIARDAGVTDEAVLADIRLRMRIELIGMATSNWNPVAWEYERKGISPPSSPLYEAMKSEREAEALRAMEAP